jgi:hypothetical protein
MPTDWQRDSREDSAPESVQMTMQQPGLGASAHVA